MSRPYTKEECREKLLTQLQAIRDYWISETLEPTTEGKMDGLIFSILAMIDGEGMDTPPFVLMISPCQDTAECIKQGENYWPEDIDLAAAGDLHHEWTRFNRRDVKARPTITPFTGLGETDE